MTTIDPVSLARGKEPIRTLAKHRNWDGKTWFGVWLIPDLAASPGARGRHRRRRSAPGTVMAPVANPPTGAIAQAGD